jgi:hypothetical protein
MDLYIDKENLISMIQSRSHDMYDDCVKVIKKQFNVFCNFSKDEIKGNEILSNWFQTLVEGVGLNHTLKFDSSFPEKPLKSNSSNNFNTSQLSAIYLLDDEDIQKLQGTGSVLVGKIGEEINTINRIFFNQNDYLFEKKWKIGSASFNKWSDLSSFTLPLTDILIVDPFISSDRTLIETNLGQLIKVLCTNVRSKVNIVLYTDRGNSIDYPEISAVVRKFAKEVTGIGPNFTLVTYVKQRGVDSLAEHDRTVFTNYIRVNSGDTFNYFDSSGKVITKGRELHFSSLASNENYSLAKILLNDIQEKIDFLKQHRNGIEGDEKSGFLNFN